MIKRSRKLKPVFQRTIFKKKKIAVLYSQQNRFSIIIIIQINICLRCFINALTIQRICYKILNKSDKCNGNAIEYYHQRDDELTERKSNFNAQTITTGVNRSFGFEICILATVTTFIFIFLEIMAAKNDHMQMLQPTYQSIISSPVR